MKSQSKVDNPIHHAQMSDIFQAIQEKDIAALKEFGKDRETDWMCTNIGDNVFHKAVMSKKVFRVLLNVIPHDKTIILLKKKNFKGKTPLDLLESYDHQLLGEACKVLGEEALIKDSLTIYPYESKTSHAIDSYESKTSHAIDPYENKTSHTTRPYENKTSHTTRPYERKTSYTPVSKVSTNLLPAPTLFRPEGMQCNPKHSNTSSASHSLAHRNFFNELFYIPPEDIELKEKLGEGSFGTIYSAHWHYEKVAVKQLKLQEIPKYGPDEFREEALMMASLHSAYIVSLKGISYSFMSYTLVMECMKMSLTKLLLDPKMLSLLQRLSIASNILKGINFLHTAFLHASNPITILHRDIKSDNILLTEYMSAKIADFGFAMAVPVGSSSSSSSSSSSKSHTQTDIKVVGSLPWMAPECFNGQYSTKSDIYAFGMVLWEIVSRKRPYSNMENREQIYERVQKGMREEIPEEMTQLEPENPTAKTPESIKKYINLCWFHDAAQRPSADELITAFDKEIKNESENKPVQLGNAV